MSSSSSSSYRCRGRGYRRRELIGGALSWTAGHLLVAGRDSPSPAGAAGRVVAPTLLLLLFGEGAVAWPRQAPPLTTPPQPVEGGSSGGGLLLLLRPSPPYSRRTTTRRSRSLRPLHLEGRGGVASPVAPPSSPDTPAGALPAPPMPAARATPGRSPPGPPSRGTTAGPGGEGRFVLVRGVGGASGLSGWGREVRYRPGGQVT